MPLGALALWIVGLSAQMPAAAPKPEPLEPVSPWTVDYAESTCFLLRTFGEPASQITFGIQWSGLGGAELLLAGPKDILGPAQNGRTEIRLGPSGRLIESSFWAAPLANGDGRLARLHVIQDDIDDIAGSATISFDLDGGSGVTLALTGLEAGIKALETCQNDLLASWGIDPDALDAVVTPAEPLGPEYWVKPDDYPMAALRARVEGRVVIAWTIGLDGRVRDCKVVQSSGAEVLDEAACNAIVERARYHPARGADGEPVISYSSRTITWTTP